MKKILCIILLIVSATAFSQKQNYKLAVAAFYNLENFYDTLDDPNTSDEEFTPHGERNYNGTIYWDKVKNLATVLSQIGTDDSKYPCPEGAAFIGVAEIENDNVLNDLVHHPLLKDRNYQIVHYDCKDKRGVDVAFLYNPKYFKVLDSKSLFVNLPQGAKEAYYTRDVLWVKGEFDGEIIHVYVNHWPSRLGGEERSAPGRAAAAMVSKKHSDSIMRAEGVEQKVLIMGDLNDDPTNASLTKVLKCKEEIKDVQEGGLYNPWVDMYKNGIGTLGFQDAWGLFDQIIVGHKWLNKKQDGYFFQKQFIFNRPYLTENVGRYKGYPMRTWDGLSYRSGYSDHFPTYLVLLKKM